MRIRQGLPAIAAGIGAAVAAGVHDDLAKRLSVPEDQAIIVAGIVGAVLGSLIETTFNWLQTHIPWLRRKFNPIGQYEGRWIEVIPSLPECPYCLTTIAFNAEEDKYWYHGMAFSQDGTPIASYDSIHLAIDSTSPRTLWFVADGQFFSGDGDAMRSYGKLSFDSSAAHTGQAIFIHFGGELKQHFARLVRVSPNLFMELFGNELGPNGRLPSDSELIAGYHRFTLPQGS